MTTDGDSLHFLLNAGDASTVQFSIPGLAAMKGHAIAIRVRSAPDRDTEPR